MKLNSLTVINVMKFSLKMTAEVHINIYNNIKHDD